MKGFWRGVWPALMVAACVVSGPAWAAEPAADAADVSWPLPWGAAKPLVYRESYTKTTRRQGGEFTVTGGGRTEITAERSGEGWRQTWRSTEPTIDASQMGPAKAVMESAVRAFSGIDLVVDLDAEGAFTGVANLDELATRYRAALAEMLGAFDARAPKEGEAKQKHDAMVTNLVTQLSAPELLRAQMSEVPFAYNYIAGGGFPAGTVHSFSDEAVMPFDPKPMKRDQTLLLMPADDVPGHYDVKWTIEPNPEDLRRVILATLDRMADGMPELEDAGKDVLRDVRFSSTIDYRIDGATGVVQWMRRTTRKLYQGRDDLETAEMRLVP